MAQPPLDPKAYTAAWSIDGSLVAVACKDKKIRLADARSGSVISIGAAHDSARPFQLAFIDAEHLVSIGFAPGSQRQILLHRVKGGEISIAKTFPLDMSPGVLFPHFDEATSILFVWGKGET